MMRSLFVYTVCLTILTVQLGATVHGVEIPDLSALTNDPEEIAQLLLENEERLLQEESGVRLLQDGPGQYMDRCGNNNPCGEGLECTEIGLRVNRCFPKECFDKELAALDFDGIEFTNSVLETAGVSEEELVATREAYLGDEAKFFETPIFQKVIRVFRDTSGPIANLQNVQRKCISNAVSSKNTTADGGDVFYAGAIFELGVLADFSYSCIEAEGNNYNRICLGAGPKLHTQYGLVCGSLTGSSDPDALCCASIWGDMDTAAVYGIGLSGGFGFNGNTMCEFTLGFGLGLGLSAKTCVTFRV